ncbi:hypothetical protein [Nonomuraea sp. NPDC049784]|uniref:hypothetical protein n=1 Tax=Nonomuraea sp. NPDC049784 TaxID=3154361 RepID=UPI0033CF3FCE
MLLTTSQMDDARHLTEQIADDLGGFTICQEAGYGGFWIRRGVEELYLHYSRSPGRVSIEGCYPEGYSRVTLWVQRHRITCAVSRGSVAIGADITRRLMPAYRADLDKVLQAIADHLHDLDQQRAIVDAIVAAIPNADSWASSTDQRVRTPYREHQQMWADFRITDTGVTVIHMQVCGIEHARRIAEVAGQLVVDDPAP